MHEKVKLLEELQDIDGKIDGRREQKTALVLQLEKLDQDLQESRLAVEALREGNDALQSRKEEFEQSLALESDNISRSEGRLHDIKTQKEYQAVLKEVSAAKKVKTELEEKILATIGEAEALQRSIAEGEQNLEALAGNITLRKGEIQGQIDSLAAEISEENAGRDTAVAGLSTSLLNRYTMLRNKRQGIAVVEAKDGSCLGCNMNIPPQMYNNLFKGHELITCPHCQRILFIRQTDIVA